MKKNRSYGQKVADDLATFGGSWRFIILFGIFIVLWISTNIYILVNKGFDPYPFILSCLAALQAPVIMISKIGRKRKIGKEPKKNT